MSQNGINQFPTTIGSTKMRWIFIDQFTQEDKEYLAHKLGWSKRQMYRKFKECSKIPAVELILIQSVFKEYGHDLTIEQMLENVG